MLVKDVIISALNILARTDLSEALSEGGIPEGEGGETVETLLYCFNAVEDELARRYVPLSAKEELRSYLGKFKYSDFSHSPVKIKRVLVGGKEADYEQTPQYIAVNADTVTIEYEYAPSKKTLDGTSDFKTEVGERLMALGMAAEYCLINGEIEASELWEKKYRERIDEVQRALPSGGNIPPRRWV